MATTKAYYVISGGVTGSPPWSLPIEYVQLDESKTAGYRRPMPAGVDKLFNGTDGSSYRFSQRVGTYTRSSPLNPPELGNSWVTLPVGGGMLPGSDVPSTVSVDDWATNLRGQLKDQSINLAQTFAERKQLVGMWDEYTSRLIKASSALRRGNPTAVYRALSGGHDLPRGWKRGLVRGPASSGGLSSAFGHVQNVASDSWLAWQYGVRPLVSDVAGATKEYFKVRGVQPLIRRVTVKPKAKSWSTRIAYEGGSAESTATLDGQVVCYAEFYDGASSWDQTTSRLGLTDPLLLAWELIPYSFVIDWFLNVGDFIHASGQISGLKRVGIHVSSKYREYATGSQWGGVSSSKLVVNSRHFLHYLPGATLNWNSSPFGGVGDVTRVLSALALTRQQFSSPSRFPSIR